MSRRVISRSKSSYFIEFIIIITGIMVSFSLNEWREAKKIDEKKEHLLSDINNDLYADSLVLESVIKYYEKMDKSLDSLLIDRNRTFNDDSLTVYLDFFTSYYPFKENATSYNRLLNDQQLTVEKEDTLILMYMNLHNYIYPSMHEWLYIEKDFILNTVLPYMDKNAPFIYPLPEQKSFDGKVFYELRKKDEFMNYLKSGDLYKKSLIKVSNGVLNYVKFVKGKINKELAENKKEE